MKTWIWENQQLFMINRELQRLIDEGIVETVVSMSLAATEDPKGSLSLYSAILIYR
jgi:hypothetical protein